MASIRLAGPTFHCINGAADGEITNRRNTEACENCDVVTNLLAGLERVDVSVMSWARRSTCQPTAHQPRCNGPLTMPENWPEAAELDNAAVEAAVYPSRQAPPTDAGVDRSGGSRRALPGRGMTLKLLSGRVGARRAPTA